IHSTSGPLPLARGGLGWGPSMNGESAIALLCQGEGTRGSRILLAGWMDDEGKKRLKSLLRTPEND
ncbi:MAG: hypothetical protein ACRC8Y_20105, partial [Chroococcales cyanobacterium]